MPDLDVQIREYFEATSTPLSVDDVFQVPVGGDLVRPMTQRPTPRPLHRGWLVGIAAAALALVVIGAVSLLSERTEGGPAGTTPDTSTSTTVEVESAPATIVPVDGPSSIVPGLGTLRWVRVTGDEGSLPRGFESDPNGGFISYESSKVWRSEDAVTWRSEPGAPEFAQHAYVSVQDGWAWALAGYPYPPELFQKVGDSWVLVELESTRLPDIVGVDWLQWVAPPVESDGTIFFSGTARAEIPWGDIYGTIEMDCGWIPQRCSQAPGQGWNDRSETLEISNPAGGSVLAVVKVTVVGDTVSFTDIDTGKPVHTIIGTADYPAERIAEEMTRGRGVAQAFGWVSHEGGALEPVVLPWTEFDGTIYAVPGGGFAAYEFAYDWPWFPEAPIVSAAMWTSTDGVVWTNRGEPQFFDPGAQHIQMQQGRHQLRASVVTGSTDAGTAGAEISDTWASTDGITWSRVATPFPLLYSTEFATDFGLVVTAMPQSRHLLWVSTDGSTWYEVDGPPGRQRSDGAGYMASGAAGDVLYVSMGELNQYAETRTLWIGRFEPSP
jgi:hypothetical protein